MADNKILVFGENVASEDYLSDAEYSTNEIRNTGNVVGLARRKPNNKALKQATLMASALAQALADSDGEWNGTEINDSLTPAGIKGIFKNYLEAKIDSFTKAISLFSNERYEYDEDTDYLPTDARTYNGELYICKQANGPTSPNIVVKPDSITPSGKDYWMKVGEGGASSYEIGQRVESLIPLTNAMLHPTDGALISGSGSYAEFVTIMAQKVSTNPELFVTEADWQSSVTTYGECGKFVYDNVANTIRLPLLNGYVKATNTAGEVGDLVEAAAPNITAHIERSGSGVSQFSLFTSSTGAITFTSASHPGINGSSSVNGSNGFDFDASLSNPIYKDSAATIDVQAIKVYSYIVLGTVTKTSIQIDIDQVMSDLALKADKDLTNLNNTGKIAIAHNAMPSDKYDDLTLGASGTDYTAPADGYVALSKAATAAGQYAVIAGENMRAETSSPTSNTYGLRIFLPVRKGEIFNITYSAAGTTSFFRFIYAVGSESEQQS